MACGLTCRIEKVGHMAATTSTAPFQNPLPTESRPHRVDTSLMILIMRTAAIGASAELLRRDHRFLSFRRKGPLP
jgi:hypothetical protein